ncbi:hypothetical protein [Intestinibacillus massiliensis]|uniref:hypothetical protein n=1 Tax=Intestinibacillus massiliensis TaxID=1871029 RepID=UPI00117A316A|nr:hypothetical protein [Intestinibacillus massiliensis]
MANKLGETTRCCLYHWRYDDLTEGCFVVDDETGKVIKKRVFDNRHRESKKDRIKYQKKEKSDADKNGRTFKTKKLKLHVGINYIKHYHCEATHIKNGLEEFTTMLSICGSDEVQRAQAIQLVSGLLSAYIVRKAANTGALDDFSKHKWRGLIFSCPYSTGAFETIAQIVATVSVDTIYQNKGADFLVSASVLLPDRAVSKSLAGDAVIYFNGGTQCHNKKFALPAQYRDTCVLIDGRAYSTGDIRNFERRNLWNTIVVYGKPASVSLVDTIPLKSESFGENHLKFNYKPVRKLCRGFAGWIGNMKKKKFSKTLQNVWNDLLTYNCAFRTARIKRGDLYHTFLQVSALTLFLNYISMFLPYWIQRKSPSSAHKIPKNGINQGLSRSIADFGSPYLLYGIVVCRPAARCSVNLAV